MKRTDLAVEIVKKREFDGIKSEEIKDGTIRITKITVEKRGGQLINKPIGRYYSLHCGVETEKASASRAVSSCLNELLGVLAPGAPVLVAGFGNANITPDSLGVLTARKVPATAHLIDENPTMAEIMRPVFVFSLGVMAKTGVESAEHLGVLVRKLRPSAVVVIDSLACNDAQRLASTIQITDTGINLGSGIGNNRKRISKKLLGVPVVAIGVPTVIDASSKTGTEPLMTTPRNIDTIIRIFSDIIAKGINSFLNPELSEDEINALLF